MRAFMGAAVTALFALVPSAVSSHPVLSQSVRALDGSGNNLQHPDWGRAGTPYLRAAAPNYADGRARMVTGPSPRYVSNRVFNDVGQNLFSENDVSQWGFVWAQFVDHTIGLRDQAPGEREPIPFVPNDPLERFTNDLGLIDFSRTPAAAGTGITSPRQQVNTVSSYIDAWNVYGGTSSRLEWLRRGPLDGNLSNNEARLLLPAGYLPRTGSRGNVAAAPGMDLVGRLAGTPAKAVVAGDVRANENIALTAVHTLFAREHNRIVAALPQSLSEEEKFQIARRVVGAEEQYITYNEFLPSLGVSLSPYRGYDATVNPTLSNEFATVGYRAHSMIHGSFEAAAEAGTYSAAQLKAFRAAGIEVELEDGDVQLEIPLNVAFGNPDLLRSIGIGRVLAGLSAEREYRNDEQIDESLRSVLFQVPKPGTSDPSACGATVVDPRCFRVVQDLGAVDIERGRDHGMPFYNDLRRAYGLAPKRSFTAITRERASRPGRQRPLGGGREIDDPRILDFIVLLDRKGNVVEPGTEAADEEVVTGIRRTTLAARLQAVYGSVARLDAFVGMLAEPHLPGTEFGELQLAIWRKQFEALRDGDRYFYANDPDLRSIAQRYGIDYRHTLAQIIKLNTGVDVKRNVFKVAAED